MSPKTAPTARTKVLCVTSYALSDDAASWRALNVAQALRELGCAVTMHQYVRERPEALSNAWAERFQEIPRQLVVSSRPSTFVRHLKSVAQEDVDVVIGNNMNGALYSLLGRLKAPLIMDVHGDMVAELAMERGVGRGAPHIRHLARMFSYKATDFLTRHLTDRVSCVSRTMMRLLRRKGVPEGKLVYVPNCVDLDFFRPQPDYVREELRSRLGVARDTLLFGYLGRLHPWQGVEGFLDAAREIGDAKCAFLVVGCREEKREGKIHFLPGVPLNDMPRHYAACDVLVLPRPSHPATEVAAPTKFAEYTAMGKPILATDVGDAAELVRRYDCGVVVRDNSARELVKGISQLRRQDDLVRVGQAARRLAEMEFNFAGTRQSLSSCIRDLVGDL